MLNYFKGIFDLFNGKTIYEARDILDKYGFEYFNGYVRNAETNYNSDMIIIPIARIRIELAFVDDYYVGGSILTEIE